MSIEADITVTVAEVEVTDEYTVELHTPLSRKHRTVLTPDEAVHLAQELVAKATEAVDALTVDLVHRGVAQHGFDVDAPLHPECRDGKCRNCDGVTMNVRDEMVPCGHPCHGAAA